MPVANPPSPEANATVAYGCEWAADVAGIRAIGTMPAAEVRPTAPIPVHFQDGFVEATVGQVWSDAQTIFADREEALPLSAYALRGATCLYPAMAVVARGNTIVRETWASKKGLERVPGFAEAKRKQLLALRREGKRVRAAIAPAEPLAGDYFLLTSSIYANYFHWLIECLPKVGLWRQMGYDRPLLCPVLTKRWHSETLAFADVPPERCVQIAQNAAIEGEMIFADRVSSHPARISPSIVPFMRSLGDRARTTGARRRIYVTRANAGGRQLLNEDELLSTLEPLGFERVALERLPFAQQVALFADADMVIAPHGAGLANIAFCKPGTIVVELGHDGMRDSRIVSYAALARCFDVSLGVVVGRADEAASAPIKRSESYHFRVAPEAVLRVLDELRERRL